MRDDFNTDKVSFSFLNYITMHTNLITMFFHLHQTIQECKNIGYQYFFVWLQCHSNPQHSSDKDLNERLLHPRFVCHF